MDGNWISAFEAFSRLAKSQHGGAADTICSRAADGIIIAKASILLWGKDRRNDREIPAEFWWARGQDALKQNWQTGDFETWIERTVYCRAYGVTFLEADIEAMLPTRHSSLKVARAEDGNYAPALRCVTELCEKVGCLKQEAISDIIRFCRAGLITSRCDEIRWQMRDRFGTGDFEKQYAAIPDWFWEHCTCGSDSVLDWTSGNFYGRGEIDRITYIVRIRGVHFDVGGVVELESMLLAQAQEDDARAKFHDPPSAVASQTGGGRPRSERWSDWIAELVAFVHEEGFPSGTGGEGQDSVIAAVESRLIDREKEGPSRSTVQPVVRAVLRRLRSAEE